MQAPPTQNQPRRVRGTLRVHPTTATTTTTSTQHNTDTSTRSQQMPIPTGYRAAADDSWVEVSSQPSSSSLSSATDEIITTGLHVRHDSNAYRRRRRRTSGGLELGRAPRPSSIGGGGSSQDEYDESESEPDRVMTSSNEGFHPSPLQHELRRSNSIHFYSSASSDNGGDDEESDDENTAVNDPRGTEPCFTPQPTAFSHPPLSQHPQSARQTSARDYFSSQRPAMRSSTHRHSYPTRTSQQHSPYNVMSPSHQADHDAALRASLSTLLSCAAAARGLPRSSKSTNTHHHPTVNQSSRIDPSSLRMVPESVAMGTTPGASSASAPRTSSSPSSSPPLQPPTKSKRPATRASSKERSAAAAGAKKARRTASSSSTTTTVLGIDEISPTLLTWAISAGVVVLVGALSFSAGYMVGKESGRMEGVGVTAAATGECGREVVGGGSRVGGGAGLKRLRWSAAGGGR